MRRTAAEKAETHREILQIAGRMIRGKGLGETGVAEVMAEAGLTHGGFYRHFDSREAMAAAAISDALTRGRESLAKIAAEAPAGKKLAAVVEGYLNEIHRDKPERGCAVVANGAEAHRAGGAVQAAYEEGVIKLVALIAGLIEAPTRRQAEDRAQAVLSVMLGGLALARGLNDPAASKRALKNARVAALKIAKA